MAEPAVSSVNAGSTSRSQPDTEAPEEPLKNRQCSSWIFSDHDCEEIKTAYGGSAAYHVEQTDEGPVITDYNALNLSTIRVLLMKTGTVWEDPVLLAEQAVITAIFLLIAVMGVICHYLSAKRHWGLNEAIHDQEGNMRAFSTIMTMLAVFMLSFYLVLIVGRWWTMRTLGVGAIKEATMELQLFLAQLVTQDKELLDAIRRYARASLQLIFLQRRGLMDVPGALKDELGGRRGILTPEEIGELECMTNRAESIWTWNVHIVKMLHEQGLIKSDQLFVYLLQRCANGRDGVQCILTHLSVQVPMQYVHLLGTMVKIHNLILAIIMGLLFGHAFQSGQIIVCVQLFARTLLIPVFFNAVLLINASLTDPFDNGTGAFPSSNYDHAIEVDGSSFVEASGNLPSWITAEKSKLKS